MNTKIRKLEGATQLSGNRPLPNPKAYARSRLTNGKDLLPNIDGRSLIARRYRDICTAITSDQGGLDQLSEARIQLIRRYAACCVLAEEMESQLVRGEQIDITVDEAEAADRDTYTRIASSTRRLLESSGLQRRPRSVGPSLSDIIDEGDQP